MCPLHLNPISLPTVFLQVVAGHWLWCPVSYIKLSLAICFTWVMYMFQCSLSNHPALSFSLWVQKSLLYVCLRGNVTHEKEGSSDTCCSTDEPGRRCAEWEKPDAAGRCCRIPLLCGSWVCQIRRDRRYNGGCPRRLGGRVENSCLMATEFQLWVLKKFWGWLVVIVTQHRECV